MKVKLFISLSLISLLVMTGQVKAQWQYSGSNIFYNNGKVGIGTNNPTQNLHVIGSALFSTNLLTGNGAALAPSFSFSSNPNTGFFRPTTNTIGITTGGVERMRINSTGNVGIGTTSPGVRLEVRGGNFRIKQDNGIQNQIDFVINSASGYTSSFTMDDMGLKIMHNSGFRDIIFGPNNLPAFVLKPNGNVGIGTSNPNSLLTVNGKILAKEVEVVSVIQSDFVFEPDYALMPLSEVQVFIETNKHLPDVPSMFEFAEKGQNLAEVQDLLLRKIEELTLYLIQQQKEIEALKAKLNIED